jgi:hypothetical protein
MSVEEKLLYGLVQIYTRGKTSHTTIRIHDGLPIPPFDINLNQSEFFDFLRRNDLSSLSVRSLVDLGSLYYNDLKDVLDSEMKRRKDTQPDFGAQLTKEVMPRLRVDSDPAWRFKDTE